jgi:hypothetical protein
MGHHHTPKKQNFAILTNFIIYMEDELAYTMIATLEGSIRTQLRIYICIRGTTHIQVTTFNSTHILVSS